MKLTIKVKLLTGIILFSFLSCIKKVEQKSKPINKTETNTQKKESIILVPKKEHNALDNSFIGKNSTELNKYNFHECFGSLLYGKSKEYKYCISQHSKIIDDCRYGKSKIILGKYIDSLDGDEQIYKIIDELNVISQDPKILYYHIPLILENQENMYLAEFEDNRKKIITKIFRIWKIDLEKEKFIEIKKPKNLTFFNPDYMD